MLLLVHKTCQITSTFPISATLTTFIFAVSVVGFSQRSYQQYFKVDLINLHNPWCSTACTVLHMVSHCTDIINYWYILDVLLCFGIHGLA
jgi:hypothetical protein